jgi:hypothetical protein
LQGKPSNSSEIQYFEMETRGPNLLASRLQNVELEDEIMTVALAIGAGLLMTAIAVAIGGLALELVLLAINRSLALRRVELPIEQTGIPKVIHLKPSEGKTGALDWAGKAAA